MDMVKCVGLAVTVTSVVTKNGDLWTLVHYRGVGSCNAKEPDDYQRRCE